MKENDKERGGKRRVKSPEHIYLLMVIYFWLECNCNETISKLSFISLFHSLCPLIAAPPPFNWIGTKLCFNVNKHQEMSDHFPIINTTSLPCFMNEAVHKNLWNQVPPTLLQGNAEIWQELHLLKLQFSSWVPQNVLGPLGKFLWWKSPVWIHKVKSAFCEHHPSSPTE